MLGTMNEASFVIFQAGVSDQAPSDDKWRRISTAAITLVGDATLITVPGTGPSDAQWVANPEWPAFSAALQSASLAVGKAAVRMDREALTEATARLAQACQSCHARFSSRLLTSPPT
jgi:cytochrome c556